MKRRDFLKGVFAVASLPLTKLAPYLPVPEKEKTIDTLLTETLNSYRWQKYSGSITLPRTPINIKHVDLVSHMVRNAEKKMRDDMEKAFFYGDNRA